MMRSSGFFLLCLFGLGLSACGPKFTNPFQTQSHHLILEIIHSYNLILKSFRRVRVEDLRSRYTGKGVLVETYSNFQSIDFSGHLNHLAAPGFSPVSEVALGGGLTTLGYGTLSTAFSRLSFLPPEIPPSVQTLVTQPWNWFALILAGTRNSDGFVGIAPEIELVNNGVSAPVRPFVNRSKIIINSRQGLTLADCGYHWRGAGGYWDLGTNRYDAVYIVSAGDNYTLTSAGVHPTAMGTNLNPGDHSTNSNVIVTVTVDEHNHRTNESNQCGNASAFCVAVPGYKYSPPTAYFLGGAVALLMQAHPSKSATEIVQAILDTATSLGSPIDTGVGLLNVQAAHERLN